MWITQAQVGASFFFLRRRPSPLKRAPLLFLLTRYSFPSLFPFPLSFPTFHLFHPQKTTTMRRTVKGGKASSKKVAKSSGAQFYGPDR